VVGWGLVVVGIEKNYNYNYYNYNYSYYFYWVVGRSWEDWLGLGIASDGWRLWEWRWLWMGLGLGLGLGKGAGIVGL